MGENDYDMKIGHINGKNDYYMKIITLMGTNNYYMKIRDINVSIMSPIFI